MDEMSASVLKQTRKGENGEEEPVLVVKEAYARLQNKRQRVLVALAENVFEHRRETREKTYFLLTQYDTLFQEIQNVLPNQEIK